MSGDKNIPGEWRWATLAEVSQIVMGTSPPGNSYNMANRGMALVNGPVEFGRGPLDKTVVKQHTTRPLKTCQEGDLLLCVRGSTTGRTNIAGFDAAIGRGVAAIRARADQAYLNYFIVSQRDNIFSMGTGSTFPNITTNQLFTLPVPVAPLSEQGRIVAKIEELFSDLDAGVAALERVRANLKRYRAAVLKAAVEGKLTEDWRAKHPDTEPASVLLERILTERRRQWEKDQLAKFAQAGKQPPKGWQQRLTWSTPPEDGTALSVPPSWVWTRVSDVGEVRLGRQRSPVNHKGPHMRPYLRVANVYEDRLDLSDVMEMNFTPEEYEIYGLEAGDILLNEGQSLELVGRPAMYRGEVPGSCFQNTLVRFRARAGVLPSYALIVFRAYLRNQRFQRIARWTVNIAHLGADRFANMGFPLPPFLEQERIVAEVERSLSIVDETEAQVDAYLKRAARLRQGILKRAFEGRLVPQDPTDEPAEKLLERIRQQRQPATTMYNGRMGSRRARRPRRTSDPLLPFSQDDGNG